MWPIKCCLIVRSDTNSSDDDESDEIAEALAFNKQHEEAKHFGMGANFTP
jgi:hypothetical protein